MESKRKSKYKVLLVVLAVIVFLIGSAAYLVFWNKAPGAAQNQSNNLINKLRTLQLSGGTLELTEDELNSTFNSMLDKPIVKNGMIINGAYVKIKKDSITLFAPIKYKGINILPNITGSICYENDRLIYNITSVKIGKLSIPKSILMNKLKAYSNNDVIIDEDKIEISKFLLPFNAENIYLSDYKIFAEIAKIALPQSSTRSESNSNTSQQIGQNSSGTASSSSTTNANTPAGNNQTNNNSSSNTQASSQVTLPAAQISSLNNVSNQLNGVIANVETDKEKQMIKKIQAVVKEVAADPSYPYQGQANEVKAWYQTLKPEEKTHVKNAILNNVNVMDILKLINIFGV